MFGNNLERIRIEEKLPELVPSAGEGPLMVRLYCAVSA